MVIALLAAAFFLSVFFLVLLDLLLLDCPLDLSRFLISCVSLIFVRRHSSFPLSSFSGFSFFRPSFPRPSPETSSSSVSSHEPPQSTMRHEEEEERREMQNKNPVPHSRSAYELRQFLMMLSPRPALLGGGRNQGTNNDVDDFL